MQAAGARASDRRQGEEVKQGRQRKELWLEHDDRNLKNFGGEMTLWRKPHLLA